MAKTVVGLYDDYQSAEQVVRELEDHGFQRDDISLIAQDASHGNQPAMQGEGETHQDVTQGAAAGAGTGAVLGGLAGLLVGLGALAIPGIGPIIAAGPLAAVLAGAGVGAVTGGIVGALVDAGVPEEQAESYAEGVRRGGTLVAVRTGNDQAEQARDIMNRFHPIDMAERARDLRGNTQSMDVQTATTTDPDSTEYSREPGQHGTQRQDWSTHDQDAYRTGTPALNESQLAGRSTAAQGTEETVGNAHETTGQGPDYSGVGHGSWETRDVGSLVSSESERSSQKLDFGSFNNDFRNHYQMIYSSQGYDYTYYEPAYRYGYDLANADRYRGRRWTEIEHDARRAWEQHNPGYGWDYFKDAVRHGWERTTSQAGGMPAGTDQGATWSGSADYGTGTGTSSDEFTGSNNP